MATDDDLDKMLGEIAANDNLDFLNVSTDALQKSAADEGAVRDAAEDHGGKKSSSESESESDGAEKGQDDGEGKRKKEKGAKKSKKDKKDKKSKKDKKDKKKKESKKRKSPSSASSTSADTDAASVAVGAVVDPPVPAAVAAVAAAEGGEQAAGEAGDLEHETNARLEKIKKKKQSSGAGRKRKAGGAAEAEDGAAGEGGEEDEKGKEKEARTPSKKRKAANEMKPEQVADICTKFVMDMELAYDNDVREISENRPAIYKTKLLDALEKIFVKKNMLDDLIDKGFVTVLRKWLAPTAGNVLPNIQIRSIILNGLTQLPALDTDELKTSGIGKVVMQLYRHPEETLQNKKLAKELIDRWSRPIFGVQTQYKQHKASADADDEDDDDDNDEGRSKDGGASSRLFVPNSGTPTIGEKYRKFKDDIARLGDDKVKLKTSIHANIPEAREMGYRINPGQMKDDKIGDRSALMEKKKQIKPIVPLGMEKRRSKKF